MKKLKLPVIFSSYNLFHFVLSGSLGAAFALTTVLASAYSTNDAFAEDHEESLGIMDQDLPSARAKTVDSIVGDRVSVHDTQRNTSLVKKSLMVDEGESIREQKRMQQALKNVGKSSEDSRSGGRESDAKLSRKVSRHTESKKVKVVDRAAEDKAAAKAEKKAAKKKKQDQKRAAQQSRKNPF